jgi:hypothetical protein
VMTMERTRLCVAFEPETVAFPRCVSHFIRTSQPYLVPMALSKIKKANINWNSFVQQSEPKVKDNPANTTKSYMSGLFCFLAGGPTFSSSSSDAGHFGRPRRDPL